MMSLVREIRSVHRVLAMTIAATIFPTVSLPVRAGQSHFVSYDDFVKSPTSLEILWKVIARSGKSKNYEQLVPLDGGTVGVANFAVGGLASLYNQMDTNLYFGKSKDFMIKNYSTSCRPKGRKGNDTGWGCYSDKWWRNGMRKFLQSADRKNVQDKAWLVQMKPTVKDAIRHGWTDKRRMAIATGIANSLGYGGFETLAASKGWGAERVLSDYARGSKHRKRRRDAINKHYPR